MHPIKWTKFDLHHHTGEDKDRKTTDFDVKSLIDEMSLNSVSLIAITNHNIISKDSYNEYKAYIASKNYEINMLPGIEVQFKLPNKENGHIILIFDETSGIEELHRFFADKSNYDPDSVSGIFEGFPNLVNKLFSKGFENFIIMPHFNKGANNISYESLGNPDYAPWMKSFDILEGKYISKSARRAIDEAIKRTGISGDKAIYMGTDAHNNEAAISNIKNKVPYVLTNNDFEGLLKMVDFPRTRISKEAATKEYLLTDKIDSLIIGEDEIKLSFGLNTIVGRRGSGKSFLLNSIANKLGVKTSALRVSENIDLSGTFNSKKIKYFKQSELAETLSKFIEKSGQEQKNDFDLTKVIFNCDRTEINDSIIKLQNKQDKFMTILKSALVNERKIIKNSLEKGLETKTGTLMSLLYSWVDASKNTEQIATVKSDQQIWQELNKKTMSPWLNNEVSKISKKLNDFLNLEKYNDSDLIDGILLKLKTLIAEKKVTEEALVFGELRDNYDFLQSSSIDKDLKELNKYIKASDRFFNEVKILGHYIAKDKTLDEEKLNFIKYDVVINTFNEDIKDHFDFLDKLISISMRYDKMSGKYVKKANTTSPAVIKTFYNHETIAKIAGKPLKDKSLGEQQQMFMHEILKLNDYDIILLDQPDDDLDSITVEENLLSKITKHFNDKQWIIVTHDPKIVMNADSRQIILADYPNEFKTGATYKNVDKELLMSDVYKIIDAKKHYPKLRGKKYERN